MGWRPVWFLAAPLACGVALAAPGGGETLPDSVPPGEEPAPTTAADDPEAPTPAPPPLIDLPASFREGWWWTPIGPRKAGGEPFSDIEVHPLDPATYAAAALDGSVWLSLDGGASWIPVMSPLRPGLGNGDSQQEEVMMRVESQVRSAIDDIDQIEYDDLDPEDYTEDPDELEPEMDELEEALDDALQSAREDALTDVQGDAWISEQEDVLQGKLDAARPRVWFSAEGWLFVGRADGLYLSRDLSGAADGQLRFRQVLEVPVTALAYLPTRGLYVAGTGDGVRFATDGVAWIDAEDHTEGLHIYDLAAAPEGMYAATSEGLYFASDAQGWHPVRSLKEPIIALQPDPDWEGGLWFSGTTNTFRSDNGGLEPRATLGAPLKGVVDLVRIGPGHLLASTNDGPWETLDGGTTWVPLPRGLTDPDCRGLAVLKGVVLLASDEGVFRMEPARPEAEEAPITSDTPRELNPGFADRILLIDSALGREGLRSKGGANRLLATVMPTLEIEAHYYPSNSLRYVASGTNPGTSRDSDADFRMVSRLTWTPTGRKTNSNTVWALPDQDGSGVFLDDSDSHQVMVTRVSRGATSYRSNLANDINHLYFARAELMLQRPEMQKASVLDQVEHGLRISEVEAMLDVLTDGAVARWYASADAQEEPQP